MRGLSLHLIKSSPLFSFHRRVFTYLFVMADGDSEKHFVVEYASQGRAKCKTCKEKIEKSSTRIGKLVSNPFSEDGGMMKQWYHVPCIFDSLTRARATTKKIDSTDDLGGFDELKSEDQQEIKGLIKGSNYFYACISYSTLEEVEADVSNMISSDVQFFC